MAELPTIDFLANDSERQFVESLQNYGFAAFRNHPLDMTLVQKIYDDWAEFFASDEKYQYTMHRNTQDGYFSTRDAESAKGFEQQDYKEYYHYYTWGRCPASLQSDLKQYYSAAHKFAATILSWVEKHSPTEVASGFSEPLSSMIHDSELTLLRVLHYPPVETDAEVCRAAPHEDINFLTILPAAAGPGLEIMARDGSWLTVTPDRSTVLVNIGDMLQEASAGYFPSTKHKVSVPTDTERQQSRMSLPLFLHPRPEVVLSERYTANSYLNERLTELGVI